MAESSANSNKEDIENPNDSIQKEGTGHDCVPQSGQDDIKLRNPVEGKRQIMNVQQEQRQIADEETEGPRRSVRNKIPTPKMLALQLEEASNRERKLVATYDKWKIKARQAREQLKLDITESQLVSLIEDLDKARVDVMEVYLEIRRHSTPSADIRRRIDACDAVTADITKVVYERMSGIDGEYNEENVKQRLRELLKQDFAHSIYGSTVSRISHKSSDHSIARSGTYSSNNSATSCVVVKRADALAELAVKEAEYKGLLEEKKQKERIQLQKVDLETQQRELERLQAERDIKVAKARLDAYTQEVMRETNSLSSPYDTERAEHIPPIISNLSPSIQQPPSQVDVSQLAQAFYDSLSLNRLPTPEPLVFNGDPIQYLEWKASFVSLIDRKGISSADKLHYLKRYVGGPARKALDGTFFRNDDEAYKDAWNKLNHRYGQPFVIQKAFREKLSKWPKIHPKDAEGLRDLSDFLNACQDAMPHVKGLQILNDCEENQRLVQRLPEWLASSWNRKVTQALNESQEFPSFQDFAAFVSTEAEIACNPITSLSALRASESSTEKVNTRDTKRGRASVLNTQTTADNRKSSKGRWKHPCTSCKASEHQISACPKFMERSLEERRSHVREANLCYGCMKQGHSVKDCRRRHTCDTCKRKHPTCLHDDNYLKRKNPSSNTISPTIDTEESSTTLALNVVGEGQPTYTSMIVPVWISSQNSSSEKLVYALLDSQSDTTFVDRDISNCLQVDKFPVKLKLTTMMGSNLIMMSERVTGLRIRGYHSSVPIDLPPAYTKECIPADRTHIPTCETARRWNHLSSIVDVIPNLKDCEIGLLIGYNCSRAMAPRQVILGGHNEPYAVRTDLGWSIVGSSPSSLESQGAAGVCHRVTIKESPPLTPADAVRVLESDFKETSADGATVSQDDLFFLNILQDGIRKDGKGHYEMPLPFKKRPYLPSNKQLATARLNHLKGKLLRNPTYKEQYIKFMDEVIERGDAQEVEDNGQEGETWYIPHHGVYHPKKPDKLRVVFDCSSKYKGASLNDHLLAGPDLMNKLNGVLIRFRQHPIALMCDIEKMFHQFHVREADQDYLRFLWWKNGDIKSQPQTFRMKVHLFGAVSSPGCANYGLKHLAKENKSLYPLGSNFVTRNFYVDDGVTSVANTKQAIKLAQEARELCASGGLRLHKFVSNNRVVLDSIPLSERATNVKHLNLTFDKLPSERALGIQWHIESDCFKFDVNLKDQPVTRRGILSTIASLYDPLGLVSPFILMGKRVLQETCKNGSDWDEPLANELRPRWERWKADLVDLATVSIPRCYVPTSFGTVSKVELHHFSDASTNGYGQCSYLKVRNDKGDIHCSLVMAKSRVSPIKVTTIPRLELTAAVVSVKTSNLLKEELDYSNIEEFFWTDSKVVLGYIRNEARRFHTFVANRIQKIHLSTTSQQWRYIPTDQNPADYASRGLTVKELLSSDWFTGPKFLWEAEVTTEEITTELILGDPEIKRAQALNTIAKEQVGIASRLSNFSSWSRATQAVARILRRINKDKSRNISTVLEREKAKSVIIKDLQKVAYQEEWNLLNKRSRLPVRSRLYNLNAFLDDDKILRVGGRLCNSSLPNTLKHPAIIPKEHHVTKMIIAHYHERVKHQGKGLTINEIRSNGYWIIGMNRVVASHISKCVTCRRLRKPTEEQMMADLPPERVDPSAPFSYSGMDCFGPFLVKNGRKVHKRYGLLFTCFCSRAIHIEMLDDMSTDCFINGLRCFIAIRGAVRQIKSDQGSNFVGAKNEFKGALQEVDTDILTTFLAGQQCDLVMNAPHSSHVGGVWERQIRTVRNILQSTLFLSSGRLDDSSLRTFFYEAMAIVNNRPLTTDNLNDPNSLEPITPNHLLTTKSTLALPPPGTFVKEDIFARKRWRHVQYLAEQFWNRWRKEYLANIAIRQRWHIPKRNLQVGDIVVMKEDDLPRNEWRLGRILEVIVDSDGLVRRVKLCLGDHKLGKNGQSVSKHSVMERPVQKLVLLLESE